MKLPEELQFMANAMKPQKHTSNRLDGKVCIVTGATSGVGYAAAKRLAEGGAELILICRNLDKSTRVQDDLIDEFGVKVVSIQADFSDLEQVRHAAGRILQEYPRLDVLINNAGLHNTRRELTPAGLEMVFCVNHLASFLLTRLLLDRLLASAPARILQVNSQGHRFGGLDLNDLEWEKRRYIGLQGYGASKVAQLLTVWELAEMLEGSGVTINAMHPGGVATNVGMNNGLLYRLHKRFMISPFLKDPKISGEAIYYLVAAPEMAEINGIFFNQTIEEIPAKHALDRDLGKQVWQISEKLTGLPSLSEFRS
jgi:NAD(P)-dependent dehydrogenase (short-subunit alcohol dehydrogenase family)